ncbi:hypothetical protein [Dankookia sp. P2]|uniref:hypothetical protein n=1 Tax=Dankookia sp. P2 TaxID=3423955 RepID=UPI003D6772B8
MGNWAFSAAAYFTEALLNGDPIDEARLSHFERLSQLDPALARLSAVIQGSNYMAEAVDYMISLLRACDALRGSDLRLPQRAGAAIFGRRLRAALGRTEAPDPGFTAPAPFRRVRSRDELQPVGRALGIAWLFQNGMLRVARSNWFRARSHSSSQISCRNSPRCDALPIGSGTSNNFAVRRTPHHLPGTRTALVRDLTATGQKIVTTNPQSALARLTHTDDRRRGKIEGDIEDEDDDVEGEIAA